MAIPAIVASVVASVASAVANAAAADKQKKQQQRTQAKAEMEKAAQGQGGGGSVGSSGTPVDIKGIVNTVKQGIQDIKAEKEAANTSSVTETPSQVMQQSAVETPPISQGG